jgi:hypothetical protein
MEKQPWKCLIHLLQLADEVIYLKIDNVELRKQISDLKGLLLDSLHPLHLEEIRSKFLSGHCLTGPTGKLQQAILSVSNLRFPVTLKSTLL